MNPDTRTSRVTEPRERANPMVPLLLCMMLAVLPGCSGDGPADAPAGNQQTEPQAKTLPIPGASDATARDASPRATGLNWSVPAGWLEETPSSSMRQAQYRVPGSGGDGTCLVFYFGPGQGGDAAGNAERWASQFSQPDGRASTDVMTITELDSSTLPALLVELTGTYAGGMTGTDQPATPQPNSMLLGAIVQGANAPWFFKFTGPESTIREQRQAFVDLITSIRADG